MQTTRTARRTRLLVGVFLGVTRARARMEYYTSCINVYERRVCVFLCFARMRRSANACLNVILQKGIRKMMTK